MIHWFHLLRSGGLDGADVSECFLEGIDPDFQPLGVARCRSGLDERDDRHHQNKARDAEQNDNQETFHGLW